MAEYVLTKKENIVAVANAVRNRTGKEDAITLAQIADDVNYVVGDVELDDFITMNISNCGAHTVGGPYGLDKSDDHGFSKYPSTPMHFHPGGADPW